MRPHPPIQYPVTSTDILYSYVFYSLSSRSLRYSYSILITHNGALTHVLEEQWPLPPHTLYGLQFKYSTLPMVKHGNCICIAWGLNPSLCMWHL